jgi:FkbM family methyltransferase
MKFLIEQSIVYLLARPAFAKFYYRLLNILLKLVGINNYRNSHVSGEKRWIATCLERFDVQTVFDVGAFKGEYAKDLIKAGFKGQLFAFEPSLSSYNALVEAVKSMDATGEHRCMNIALSDQQGSATMYDYGATGSSHATLYEGVIADIHGTAGKAPATRTVSTDTLDNFCTANQIQLIDLLKIDTEGNEFRVLKGAERMLQEGRIRLIQFEFNEMNVVSRVFFKDFYDLLAPRYDLYRLLPSGLLPISNYDTRQQEILIFQNIVAVRKAS